jgi:magnesium transporter
LAIPVIDADRQILGIAEISVFTEGVLNMDEKEQTDEAFEALGFRLSAIRNASSLKAYAIRFPWLLATVGSGTCCALLTSRFEKTLEKSIVLAFFLTMVLGLAESVSIQSMTVSIQSLRGATPTWRLYRRALKKELRTSLLLGLSCGLLVGLIVLAWRGEIPAALVIGSGIGISLIFACIFGLSMPTLLHALKLDPKIAAGPITLALTDLFALLFYFTLASIVL